MREIKFRAWDGIKMQTRFAVDSITGKAVIDVGGSTSILALPDNYIVMQFTGLLDSKGVEIYEGDLLSYNDRPTVYEVRFSELSGQWFGCNELYTDIKAQEDVVTVIGNIYQHHELLEATNE